MDKQKEINTYSDLDELNEEFYYLFGRLYENRELLSDDAAKAMSKNLFDQYSAEYEILSVRKSIRQKKELYREKLRHGCYVPHRILLLWKNRAMKLSRADIGIEFGKWVAEYEKRLTEASNALEKAVEGDEAEDERPLSVTESSESDKDGRQE